MQWLTAALAFATTMLFFALVVSTLVEMIHRFIGLREKGLQLMLESLFKRVVKPHLDKLASDIDAKEFAAIIMTNRAVAVAKETDELRGKVASAQARYDAARAALKKKSANKVPVGAAGPEGAAQALKAAQAALDEAKAELDAARKAVKEQPSRINPLLRWMLSSSQVTSIPVEIFTQKLADSRIVAATDRRLAETIQDISQKYVAFGAEATEYFRRRAQLFSVLVAFPVALFFYVHPYELARVFLSDHELAERVAQHKIDLAYGTEAASTENGQTDAPEAGGEAGGTPPNISDETGMEAEIAELKRQNEALKQSIKDWDELAIPVGWPDARNLPVCGDADRSAGDASSWPEQACAWPLSPLGTVTVPSLSQVFWLVVGALLIGLGAPFWAQAVGALTASRAASEKIASIVGGNDAIVPADVGGRAVPQAAAPSVGEGAVPTAVRTFEVSRKAER